MQIRPISDLQNDYNSIEKAVLENNQTVYLTKNGYGSMVMVSLDNFTKQENKQTGPAQEQEATKREHIGIISKSRKVVDDDDE